MKNTPAMKTPAILFGFWISLMAVFPVTADDTEIFTGTTSGANIRPNVLFVLDTSSSMVTIDAGETETRLDRMKAALNSILDSVTNVNVGMMRFSGSNSGGPVLFPVSYVDEDVCNIETCTTTGPNLAVRVADSADDAEESNGTGAVDLTGTTIDMVTEGTCSGTLVENNVSVNDSEQLSDGTHNHNSTDLEFMYDSNNGDVQQAVGVRFQGVNIPNGATINCAEIIFTVDEAGSGTVSLDIAGDDTNDSVAWADSPANRTVSGRSRTVSIDWDNLPNPAVGSALTTPDIAVIVQEIVDNGGWSAGRDMGFMFFPDTGFVSDTANRRIVESNNGSAAPKLRVYYDTGAATAGTQTIGLRFQNVQIPQGVTITSASLEFEVNAASSVVTDLTIKGELTDDAAPFTTAVNNISGRAKTAASVAWTGVVPWSTADDKQSSPDIKSIVQEIVNRGGWCGGQNLAMIISGIGQRSATAYDGTMGDAPLLRVAYDPATIPAAGGCMNTTITKTISSGSDDAEENLGNSTISINSSDLELPKDSSDQAIGLRFTDLAIPQGATIVSASLQFEVDEANAGDAVSLTIYAQNSDDALAFSASAGNISSRPKTTASVAWNSVADPAIDSKLNSPDITAVVQEVVNRGGWTTGSDMAFIIMKASGTGKRVVESYDGEASAAARLTVQLQWDSGSTTTATQTVRDRLKSEVQDLEYKSGTPIVDALYEAALYYKGLPVDYGKVRGTSAGTTSRSEYTRVSHPGSYTGGTLFRDASCTDADLNSSACKTEAINGAPVYSSPISDTCQTNHIVLLTDGAPSSNSAAAKAKALGSLGSCANPGTNMECGPELAKYLFENDQSLLSGTQNIITYTIGFAYGDTWIQSIATDGGGTYKTATSAADLANAFNNILAAITTTTSTFVAPGAAVNQFNRLRHDNDIYFSLFKPQTQPRWDGNLKRYEINTSTLVIEDATGAAAVDDITGFFKDSSKSFWSAAADGNEVEQGGAAEQRNITRNTYTYVGAAAATMPYSPAIDLTVGTQELTETNASITDAMLGAASATERSNILKFARGVDLRDYDEDGNTSEVRLQYGDPLHSRPVIVTYGGTSAAPDNAVFFATNEGFLHALDPDDGTEFFSFIPQELLPNLKTYYNNSSADAHPYGMDGYITPWIKDVDQDGIIESADGDHVYLYIGMRRGGSSYYALDVTDRSNPKLIWKITGGAGDYAELAQSWSAPILGKVNFLGTEKQVLIFAGGYDEDQDSYTTRSADGQGRAIYMVNAETGVREWWGSSVAGSNETFADMDYSIAGNVRAIDTNLDDLIDLMYVADMGGQIWRFDVHNDATTLAKLVDGTVLANLATTGSVANTRRFYTTPDVAKAKENGTHFYSIAIGSGWRAHPLDENVSDRFYLIRDTNFNTTPTTWTAVTESDLYDATNDVDSASVLSAIAGGKKGWFIQMENTGEKVLSDSATVNNQVIFSSYTPNSSTASCSAAQGTGRTYVVNLYDATPTVNLASAAGSTLTKADRTVELKRGGIPPKPTVLILPEPVVLVGPETPLKNMPFGDLSTRTFWYQIDE